MFHITCYIYNPNEMVISHSRKFFIYAAARLQGTLFESDIAYIPGSAQTGVYSQHCTGATELVDFLARFLEVKGMYRFVDIPVDSHMRGNESLLLSAEQIRTYQGAEGVTRERSVPTQTTSISLERETELRATAKCAAANGSCQ